MFSRIRLIISIVVLFASPIVAQAQSSQQKVTEKNEAEVPVKGQGKIPNLADKGNPIGKQPNDKNAVMTTQLGIPVGNGQDSLKLGKRGPTLLEDFQFREKIFQLTTSGFLSVSYMHADLARMASMKPPIRLPTPR